MVYLEQHDLVLKIQHALEVLLKSTSHDDGLLIIRHENVTSFTAFKKKKKSLIISRVTT